MPKLKLIDFIYIALCQVSLSNYCLQKAKHAIDLKNTTQSHDTWFFIILFYCRVDNYNHYHKHKNVSSVFIENYSTIHFIALVKSLNISVKKCTIQITFSCQSESWKLTDHNFRTSSNQSYWIQENGVWRPSKSPY